MLSNFKALETLLVDTIGRRTFHRSYSINEEECKNYLDLILCHDRAITLPRKIVPNTLTLCAFTFTYRYNSLNLPILLKYFTYNKLLEVAKNDLEKIHQELQSVMNEDLRDRQNLQDQFKRNGEEIDELISAIKEIESYKELIKDLFNGKKVGVKTGTESNFKSAYPKKYYSMLKEKLIEMMKGKLVAYAHNDTNINKIYQSFNDKAKKIKRLDNIQTGAWITGTVIAGLTEIFMMIKAHANKDVRILGLMFLIVPLIFFMGPVIADIAWSKGQNCRKSFAKELQCYMESGQLENQSKMIYPKEYPDLSEMDVDNILGRQQDQDAFSDVNVTQNSSQQQFK